MSRARNIKPGFFKNELLVDLPFEFRLLFVGLWTMADRDGRLEDRPTKIRMELFPADAVDVNAGLQALHDAGFVQRYEVDGKRFLQVLAWSKHQNPHMKEAASTIPAPCLPGANPVLAPAKAHTSPADSLIPDSLIPEKNKNKNKNKPSPAATAMPEPPAGVDPEAWDGFVAMRKRIRFPLTTRAATLIHKRLAELEALGNDPNEILDQSTRNGWRDVFELKSDKGNHHANRTQRSRPGLADRHPRTAESRDSIPGTALRIVAG